MRLRKHQEKFTIGLLKRVNFRRYLQERSGRQNRKKLPYVDEKGDENPIMRHISITEIKKTTK